MIAFRVMSFECCNQITQAFSVGELSKHHSKKLIPTSQMFDKTVSVVLGNDMVKHTSIEECN